MNTIHAKEGECTGDGDGAQCQCKCQCKLQHGKK
jgi:hypothetical protein